MAALDPSRLFRLEELAALIGRSYGALRRDASEGRLRVVTVGARSLRVPADEVDRVVRGLQRSGTPIEKVRP